MLKHSYHARLSFWHLVLLVVILAITLPAVARTDDQPTEALKQASSEMLTALKTYRPVLQQDPRYIFILVNEILTPQVDMQTASRLALGKHWRTATSEQREQFTEEFRNLLVRYYSLMLVEYLDMHDLPDDVMEFLPAKQSTSGYRVRSKVNVPHGNPVTVDYDVHRVGGKWKVYDINVRGISLVSAYRAVFKSEIHKHGLSGLLTTLAEQNRKLLKA